MVAPSSNITRLCLAQFFTLARRLGVVERIVLAVTGEDREADEPDVDGGQD